MLTEFLLYGAGGHGKVVLDALQRCGISVIVVDDKIDKAGESLLGVSIRLITDICKADAGKAHIAIGDNHVRRKVVDKLSNQGWIIETVIHPLAIVSKHASIGYGSFVAPSAVVAPDAAIGRGTIINHGATIDHDCSIGDFCHIAPNATLGGAVAVGHNVLLGSGAVVLPGSRIGENAIVAAGAVVRHDVTAGTLVAGIPAVRKSSSQGTPA